MRHKNVIISLAVYSIYIFGVISFFYFYDSPCKVLVLGHGYYIDYDPNSDLALFAPPSEPCADIQGPIIILGPIIKYSFNDKYIAIKEKPRQKIDTLFGLDNIGYYPDYQKTFANVRYYNYWIIDKSIDSVFGPYEKNDFRLKFKELNLPDSLMIK